MRCRDLLERKVLRWVIFKEKKTRGIIRLCVKYHPKSDREQINEHFQQRLSSYWKSISSTFGPFDKINPWWSKEIQRHQFSINTKAFRKIRLLSKNRNNFRQPANISWWILSFKSRFFRAGRSKKFASNTRDCDHLKSWII